MSSITTAFITTLRKFSSYITKKKKMMEGKKINIYLVEEEKLICFDWFPSIWFTGNRAFGKTILSSSIKIVFFFFFLLFRISFIAWSNWTLIIIIICYFFTHGYWLIFFFFIDSYYFLFFFVLSILFPCTYIHLLALYRSIKLRNSWTYLLLHLADQIVPYETMWFLEGN